MVRKLDYSIFTEALKLLEHYLELTLKRIKMGKWRRRVDFFVEGRSLHRELFRLRLDGREREGGAGRGESPSKSRFVYIFFTIEQEFHEIGKKNKNMAERMFMAK